MNVITRKSFSFIYLDKIFFYDPENARCSTHPFSHEHTCQPQKKTTPPRSLPTHPRARAQLLICSAYSCVHIPGETYDAYCLNIYKKNDALSPVNDSQPCQVKICDSCCVPFSIPHFRAATDDLCSMSDMCMMCSMYYSICKNHRIQLRSHSPSVHILLIRLGVACVTISFCQPRRKEGSMRGNV